MWTRSGLAKAVMIGILVAARAHPQPAAPVDAFQIRYAANLTISDSYINLTNAGTSSTSAGLNGGFQNGNLCVNVYAYSPDEQLVSCCSCLVTPNAVASLSAVNDVILNPLTPIRPSSLVVKLLATDDAAGCNAAGVQRTGANSLKPGLVAWMTTAHALPVNAGTPPGAMGVTETPFSRASLSDAEFTRMTQLCAFIRANGSGYGICKSCRFGALGGATK
jgi:hypothetical protein